MTSTFPFPTERHQDEVPPSSVHQTDFDSLTDPALDTGNNVLAGKRWRQPDSLTAPTKYRIYRRDAVNAAWILEGAWGIEDYLPGQVPVADEDGYLWPGDVEGSESGGGPGSIAVQDEGTPQGDATTFDFVGSGVSASVAGGVATVTVSGGSAGLVLIQRLEASSSATLDFTTGIDDTYDQYELHIGDFLPANDGIAFYMTVSTNAGSSWEATSYRWVNDRNRSGSSGLTGDASDSAAQYQMMGSLTAGNATGEAVHGRIILHNPRSTTRYKAFTATMSVWESNGGVGRTNGAGGWGSATAINGVRLLFQTGNITSGWAALYGVRKT